MALFWFDKADRHRAQPPDGDDLLSVVTPAEREQVEGRAMLVKRLKPLPVEVVVRGYLAGQRLGRVSKSVGLRRPLPPGLQRRQAASPSSRRPPRPNRRARREHRSRAWSEIIGADLATRVRDISIQLYQRAADYRADRASSSPTPSSSSASMPTARSR